MTSGQSKLGSVRRQPEIGELATQAKVFGTAVKLAAAGRSCGATTAVTGFRQHPCGFTIAARPRR